MTETTTPPADSCPRCGATDPYQRDNPAQAGCTAPYHAGFAERDDVVQVRLALALPVDGQVRVFTQDLVVGLTEHVGRDGRRGPVAGLERAVAALRAQLPC